jgi:hypothetical protein
MEPAKIVLRALAIYCGYGALFGLVCAWLCPEAYLERPVAFGHPPVLVLGMLWGTFDFLTFSAAVGVGIALAAHVGHRPTVKAFFFTRPMLLLMVIAALVGAVAGIFGRNIVIAGEYQYRVPHERQAAYLGTWWALLASQAVLVIGGATVAVWTWRKRILFEKMVQAGELGAPKH